jgi:ATP:corrinoid adenosyltransferase
MILFHLLRALLAIGKGVRVCMLQYIKGRIIYTSMFSIYTSSTRFFVEPFHELVTYSTLHNIRKLPR